jgi:AcrR family transcriptional regulator
VKCITQRLRAIGDEEKALRRRDILDAARELFSNSTEALPSVINIARASGLAKGTVYLYFKTKEEIFLAILADDYSELLRKITLLLSEQKNPADAVNVLLTCLLEFLDQHPLFMPLASMSSSVIEKNVDINIVKQFKLMLVDKIDQIDLLLQKRFPQIPSGECERLLLHTNALILGLWQMQNWPKQLAPLKNQPPFNKVVPNFKADVETSVRNLWTGSLLTCQA